MAIAAPRIKIVRAEGDKPFTVQTCNIDLVGWDRTRAKHKWPATADCPFLWLTFLAWSAARRTGKLGGDVSYEAFEASTFQVEAVDDDDQPMEAGSDLEPTFPTSGVPVPA